ncbi:MAG: phosphoribosylamine--glycine ligase [candidate division WOR-3 bacterium]
MKVLVVGSGGREHALVWALTRFKHKVFCVPGNFGISRMAECEDIYPLDIPGIISFAQKKKVDLTIVGPEAPLVAGIADEFEKKGILLFGPKASAACLEGDKAFAKHLMERYEIPTARFTVFEEFEQADDFLKKGKFPLVIKASGLAAGKGVSVVNSYEEGVNFLKSSMKEGKFGEAGKKVVIEEFLSGEECSIIGLCDGKKVYFLLPSQDHKRLLDDDKGPNTGGMGAYAPVPAVTQDVLNRIVAEVFQPLLTAFEKEGIDYRGAIYAGIILTSSGPKVLEFNCRFGDPETQAILPLLEVDLAQICFECALGNLSNPAPPVSTAKRWAVCVVAAAPGYPGDYQKELPISGELIGGENTIVFHAGTKLIDGKIVTSGGRVLGVTGLGETLAEAQERAYYGIGLIHFPNMHYRHDIGAKGLKHLKEIS